MPIIAGEIQPSMIRELKAFTENTPNHASVFNEQFKALLDNDLTLEKKVMDDLDVQLDYIKTNILAMGVELETLKGSALNGITANIMIEELKTASDIKDLTGSIQHDPVSNKIFI